MKDLRLVFFAILAVILFAAQTTFGHSGQSSSQNSAANVITGQKIEKHEKVYHIGGDVKPPRKISAPEPILDPTKDKNAGKHVVEPGSTVLRIIVGEDGLVRNVEVFKSLNHDFDAKAIEAVRQWKFEPATKKGKPVAVEMGIEVNFHMYR